MTQINEAKEPIKLAEKTYRIVYTNKTLLSNVLTSIRVIRGVSVVYQRDSIKKSGNKMSVPLEVGYVMPPVYGGREKYLSDLETAIKRIPGVISMKDVSSEV